MRLQEGKGVVMGKKKRQSGFEDDPDYCPHRQHNPPSYMVVPPGKIYRHVCPRCGRESILRSHGTFMKGAKNALQG